LQVDIGGHFLYNKKNIALNCLFEKHIPQALGDPVLKAGSRVLSAFGVIDTVFKSDCLNAAMLLKG